MTQVYLIDADQREIFPIPSPFLVPATQCEYTRLNDAEDLLISFPYEIIGPRRAAPFIIDHTPGLYFGRALIVGKGEEPSIPLAAARRMVNWVSTLMVCNGAKSVIPRRPAL